MGHTYSNILIHAIFSTKDRLPSIRDSLRERLYEYLAGIAQREFGHAVIIGGTNNHLHGLLQVRCSVSVAEAIRKWKSLSSGWIRKSFVGNENFSWQEGYGAFSVSQSNVSKITRYITNQVSHHKRITFEAELLSFLKPNGIKYDAQHLWD